jgi:hypothetical protein
MPATMTTVSAITKEIYEGSLRKQLNEETVALRRLEKTSEGVTNEVGGKYVTFPIHTTRNAGIGARNELEQLPNAGQQGTAAARVGLKYLYGRVRLSGQTMELAKTNSQAFMSALDLEMNGLKDDLKKDQNRQVYGDGIGGVHRITAAATTATPTVAHTIWGQLGMQVDVTDSTGVTIKASNRQITAITDTTVTFSGATQAVVVGDLITRTGSSTKEWTGLSKIVQNSGTLYNVDPTTVPVWTSEVDSNAGTGRALSEGLMILMVDRIRRRGGKTTVIFQNLGVRRAYFNLLTQQRRFTNTKEFAGGFTGLTFTTDQGEIPVVVDVDCPPGTMYFLNEDELKWYRESDWSFMDRDGSMWQRVIDYDAYDAIMFQYSELGTHRRNTHGVIVDITEG